MAKHSEDFGQVGQTCDECSPCWPHRGGFGRCPCDCHPADPAADLEYAMAVIEHLQAENERLRKVENDALWLARLACSSSWPMDMAQQVESAAERVKAAFSGSPTQEETP